eukprot:PhF_6_TR1942/c1_g3_i4/m.3078
MFDVATTDTSCQPENYGFQGDPYEVTFPASPSCTLWDLIQGFRVLLGLHPEHTRPDRDLYIYYDSSAAKDGKQFTIDYNRMYGAYDSTSVFQWDSYAYAKNGQSILSGTTTQQLGRRSTLSPMDVQRINFIHNDCSNKAPVPPNCVVSLPTNTPITVGYSQTIDIQMVCMSSSNTGGTFVNDQCALSTCVTKTLKYTYKSGEHYHWQWTPTTTLSNQSIAMSLTFTKSGKTVTKTILFTVLNSLYACFGLGSLDAKVCSGHGKCGVSGVCTCSNSYTGPNCNLTASCPYDTTFDFDNDVWNG